MCKKIEMKFYVNETFLNIKLNNAWFCKCTNKQSMKCKVNKK